jgi:hypothetical protein
MAKKKKKNALLNLLKRSWSGWVKAAKYVNSGKWADDYSRAMYRGNAGKRAAAGARAKEQQREDIQRGKDMGWNHGILTKMDAANLKANRVNADRYPQQDEVDNDPIDWSDELDRMDRNMGKLDRDQQKHEHGLDRIRKGKQYEAPSNVSAKKQVESAKQRAAKATAQVKQHDRKGSSGVKAHQRNLTPKEQKAHVAKELMNSSFSDADKQRVKELTDIHSQGEKLSKRELNQLQAIKDYYNKEGEFALKTK